MGTEDKGEFIIDEVNKISFDVNVIRNLFPILDLHVHDKLLVYLDSAATTQKPISVIRAIERYYEQLNSNVHRATYTLGEEATAAFEETRENVRQFINAEKTCEIIFVKGTTDGVNLVASTFGESVVNSGDNVIITQMEHHSNMVPWQMLCKRKSAEIRYIPVNEKGELVLDGLEDMIDERTRMLSLVYVSNSLGTINPVKKIIEIAHKRGVPVMIDAAQAVPHLYVDVRDLDCDFLAFSGHKVYGPTGIGILYGKEKFLEMMPPYQFGGEMITEVKFSSTKFNELPYKFEAGTPNIADAVALKPALEFVEQIGYQNMSDHEGSLVSFATEMLCEIEGVRIIGNAANKAAVVSFVIDGAHPYDMGTLLDQMGIAVRTGFHCTQPLIEEVYGLPGTVRASFGIYNTIDEVNYFVDCVKRARNMLV
jgi:cysteine desulfurase/selenocysteine lyase